MKKPESDGPEQARDGFPAREEINAILNATHGDAFSVLGIHDINGSHVARCFLPGAEIKLIVRFVDPNLNG